MPVVYSQSGMGFYLPLSDIILRVCTSPDTSSETSPQTGNDLLLSTSIREESGEIHWIISLYQVNEKAQGNVKGMRTRGLLYSERSGPTALGCWAEEAREALENGEFELDDGAKMSFCITPASRQRFKFEPIRYTHTGGKDLFDLTARVANCPVAVVARPSNAAEVKGPETPPARKANCGGSGPNGKSGMQSDAEHQHDDIASPKAKVETKPKGKQVKKAAKSKGGKGKKHSREDEEEVVVTVKEASPILLDLFSLD